MTDHKDEFDPLRFVGHVFFAWLIGLVMMDYHVRMGEVGGSSAYAMGVIIGFAGPALGIVAYYSRRFAKVHIFAARKGHTK